MLQREGERDGHSFHRQRPVHFTLCTLQPQNEQKREDCKVGRDAMKRRRCRALSAMMLFTQPAHAPLLLTYRSPLSLSLSFSMPPLILSVYSRSRCHQPRAMQLPHSRVIRFVPPKVLISTPPCHLRNLFGTLSPPPPRHDCYTRSLAPHGDESRARERAVCQPSSIDSAAVQDRERKREMTSIPEGGEYNGPPIIDAVADAPLTQNKISARNVLCTPASTTETREGEKDRKKGVGRPLSTAVPPPDPFLHVAHRRVPYGYPPRSPPAPPEPVSLLHANSIRGAWSSRGIPYYDTGGLKKETKNADGRAREGGNER